MALKALFISVSELKKKSIIDGNVDSDKILQYIEIAQDIHIQNYLGGNLYKAMQELIVSGIINDPIKADYKELLDEYIKPMLVWYTQSTYLPYTAFQVSNGGTFKHRSENSDSVTKDEMDYLVQKSRNTAEFYTKRYMEYICNNSNKYPEYNNTTIGEMYPDKDINYTGGWFL